MRTCFPVAQDRGLDSRVYPHFGSTPMFLVVDSDTRVARVITNGACDHAHGQCDPLAALGAEQIDAVVVGGIGPGAIARLRSANVAVYWAARSTVGDALDAIARGDLAPIDVDARSAAHGIGCDGHHGDGHGHGAGPHRHG